MKTLTKRFTKLATAGLAIVGLLIGLAPMDAAAQFRSESITTLTNVVPATSTNSTPMTGIIDVSRVHQFALQINSKLQGAGTSAVRYDVYRSLDQSNWELAFQISKAANGTTAVVITTNVTCGGFPYWKIGEVGNPNATALTNLAGIFGTKRNVD